MFNLKYIRYIFKSTCIIVAISLVIWQIHEYIYSNDDIVQVIFKRFNSNKDRLYPALTLCFNGNRKNTLLHQSNQNLLKNKLYQAGSNHSTLNIEDYIASIKIKDFKNHNIRYSKGGKEFSNDVEGRTLSTYEIGNCFAIGIPFLHNNEINSIMVEIKKNIFEIGNVPTNEQLSSGHGKFSVGLTYGNSFFPVIKKKFNIDTSSVHHYISKLLHPCSGYIVYIRSMEIVIQRNKPEYPCTNAGLENSIKLLEDLVEKMMCKPKYWNFPSDLPDCNDEELVASRANIDRGMYDSHEETLIKPCRYIQSLWSDHEFLTSCANEEGINGTFQITVVYNDVPFKEISMLPSHTFWGLITNLLTIVGIILGVSVFNIPEYLKKGKTRLNRTLSSNNVESDENEIIDFEPTMVRQTKIRNRDEIFGVERLI